jgi:hypothetical protein
MKQKESPLNKPLIEDQLFNEDKKIINVARSINKCSPLY